MAYGETSWDAPATGNGGGKVEFIKLSQGENKFRIVTNVFSYPVHKGVKADGQGGYGRKVNCSRVFERDLQTGRETKTVTSSCPLCEAGHPVKTHYMFGVIDRSDGRFRVIDVSWQIYSIIKGLVEGGIWGHPKDYDIMVKKNPNSTSPNDYYLVQPIPKEPLSVTDQRTRDEADTNYLQRKTAQPTYAEAEANLARVLEGGTLHIPEVEEKAEKATARTASKPSQATRTGNGKKATPTPPAEMTDDEAVNDTFSDFDTAN